MRTYLAFLRGINVGGKGLIKMADLKESLDKAGLGDVRTYIQSGNVIFRSDSTDTKALAAQITSIIKKAFQLDVSAVVFSEAEWRGVIESAPAWWGTDKTRKHNLIIMISPYDTDETIAAIGTLKPDIESIQPGRGVIYQSLSWEKFGKTTSGKLASSPVYKKMTIRSYSTATKLLALLD
jgi:uncharacterized protein (DUF1697 family)